MKKQLYSLLGFCFLSVGITNAQNISTYAGDGTSGMMGDGGPATAAQLYMPTGIAFDHSGNLYISNVGNSKVRKVSAAGIITQFANITSPFGIVIDASNNLYISDYGAVRKVTPSGTVSLFAGDATGGYGGDGGAATAAQISPNGIALDATGNIYIADAGNNRVRKINTSGIITTIAGTGTAGSAGDGSAATAAQLNFPSGVAVDGSGNVYIADNYNSKIRKVSAAGIISTYAGTGTAGFSGDGGAAAAAQLSGPYHLAIDGMGNLYISDGGMNNRIRKISGSGIITTIAGMTGSCGYDADGIPATASRLCNPIGLAFDDSNNVYISDQGNNRIRRVPHSGSSTATGIEKTNSNNASVSIYPNPSEGDFTISYQSLSLNAVLQITDITGRAVYAMKITDMTGKKDINLSNVPNGIYYYKIISDSNNAITGKLIIGK